jgi:carboxylate-amine ligase
MRDILAMTALIQALVLALAEQYENPEPHSQILRSNKWQATRYGLDGFYVDPFFARKYSMKEAAINLYRHVRPIAEELKSIDYLDGIPVIVERLTCSHHQKKLYIEDSSSFTEIIQKTRERFFK